MTNRNCILFVNGHRKEILPGDVSNYTTAFDYLRDTIGVRSLKNVSRECGGGSNLCAVIMVTALNPATGVVDTHRAMDALSTPIITLHGCAITTLEALSSTTGGGKHGGLHPIQARLVASGASMCGYCTPGVCMLLYTLLMSNMQPTIRDVDRALAGLWCRCSGFRAVNDVARSFAVDFDEALKAKLASDASTVVSRDDPHPPMDSPDNYPPLSSDQSDVRVVISSSSRIAALRKEIPLYPHEHLKPPTIVQVPPLYLYYGSNESAFLLPSTVDEVIRSSKVVPDYTTVNGSDEFHHQVLSRVNTPEGPPMAVLSTCRVKEMLELHVKLEGTPQQPQATTFIGASATLATIAQRLPKLITPELSSKDPWTVAALLELRTAIEELSASQVEENSFTLVGHMMARPCGDLVPFLHCLKASLVVLSSRGREEHSVVDVTGASRSIAKLDVVLGLKIPSQRNRFVGYAKATLAGPRSPSTSAVALACDVTRRDSDIVACDFSVACAGSSFYLTVLPEVASCLDRTNLTSDTMKNLRNALDKLLMSLRNLVHGPSDGRVSYRITVTRSLIFRLMCKLQAAVGVSPMDPSALRLDLSTPHLAVSFGVQSWEASFGGISSSRHVPDDTQQIEIEQAPASPAVSPANDGQSKALPPVGVKAGSGGAGGKPALGAATKKTTPPTNNGPKAEQPVSKLLALSPSQQPITPTSEAVPLTGPIRRLVTPRCPVGDPLPNIRAISNVTALSPFIPDIPLPRGCLHAAFIRSTIPKGLIKGIDTAPALALGGVVGYFDVRDVPAKAVFRNPPPSFFASARKPPFGASQPQGSSSTSAGSMGEGEKEKVLPEETRASNAPPIFADKDVEYIGQIIGVIVAVSSSVALQAAKLVSVEYVKDHRVSYTLSISESREAKAFFPTEFGTSLPTPSNTASPSSGAAGRAGTTFRKLFDNKDLTTHTGTFNVGGQFAMPSQATCVVCSPGTDDKMEVRVTTEDPSFMQSRIAATLLIPASAVNVVVPPMGGPQPEQSMSSAIATAVALASYRLRQPVMFIASLEEDTATRGLSPSATVEWRCAVDPVTSAMQGVDVQVYLNCGAAKGNNDDILRSVLSHICGGYHVPMLRARGVLCRTNFPPMCAHVGIGPAIGALVLENIMDAVSRHMKVPRWKLQEAHLLPPNEALPYGQVPGQVRLPTVWQDLIISANVGDRMKAAQQFNMTHRFRKRGIALVPVLIGCRLPIPDDHEHRGGTATVSIFPDGTVCARHGVVDCGLGVDTKVAQVISRVFCVPMERIRVETANTSGGGVDVSACSATRIAADVACVSVLNACEILKKRLDGVVRLHQQRPSGAQAPPGDLDPAAMTLGEKVQLAQRLQVATTATGIAVTGSSTGGNSTHDESSPLRSRDNSDPLISFEPGVDPEGAVSANADGTTPASPLSNKGRSATFERTFASESHHGPGVLCPAPSITAPFAYFVQGASCAEVELDVLTGTHRVVRADVLIDAGQSLNPLLDTIHVEAQFVKGSGWLTTEEVICGDAAHPDVPEGTFLNAAMHGSCGYALPRLHDAVPQDFRVALYGGATSRNQNAGVHGARSVVEASLLCGSAVMFALREAAYAAREHWSEVRPPFLEMHAPLSAERLRMACTDEFSQGTFGGAECAVNGSY